MNYRFLNTLDYNRIASTHRLAFEGSQNGWWLMHSENSVIKLQFVHAA